MMKKLSVMLAILSIAMVTYAVPPSFHNASSLEGWNVVSGSPAVGTLLQASNGSTINVRTNSVVNLPIEATVRFRVGIGDEITCQALLGNADPVLEASCKLTGPNQASIRAYASGKAMPTTGISERNWTVLDKVDGWLYYRWRFPQVRNLWDERDRQEIGSSYAALAPFSEKIFTLRMVLTAGDRQIWLDDRLVAERRMATPPQLQFALQLARSAQVLSIDFHAPAQQGAYLPLSLTSYSHAREMQSSREGRMVIESIRSVPVMHPTTTWTDLDLGQSLFRYRMTQGSGPNVGYVQAEASWPGPFTVDPASFTFRVPYRNYRNIWLLAWLDDRPDATPRGSVQFYKATCGYPARTDFEITPEAIRRGLVKALPQRNPGGKPLFLVKVPVDTDGLYGMRDLADQFLDFEISKPVSLMRSYPDPIYYGFHAGGLPSSVHIVGMTLEEAPFGYEVQPAQTGDVFELPQQPAYTVSVENTTDKPFTARIALAATSFDGSGKGATHGKVTVAPHRTGAIRLALRLQRLGWHEVKVAVEAVGQTRRNTLSLVMLPPNTRTYGNAPNETRFGIWELLGHYVPLWPDPTNPKNDSLLALFRQIGLRRISPHTSFVTTDMLKRHDFLTGGGHTAGGAFTDAVLPDGAENPPEMARGVASEVAPLDKLKNDFPVLSYFYGGEWAISKEIQYAPWPRYTDEGDRDLTATERENASRHVTIFTAIGKAIRARAPQTRLILQWGAPSGSIAYLRAGMPKDLVDLFGMDAPQFELLPEVSNVTGSINDLWAFRQESQRMGWPRLPMAWCEGPFFPTNPGALTEVEQAEYQIRYWLMGLAYGIEQFESGVVTHDAGNYYGAEHYGAGLFHRLPLEHPKPAVAAVATATAMLCGADVVGGVETGCLTTYCLAFKRAREATKIFALWRVNGTGEATIRIRGTKPVLTDAMGNAVPFTVKNNAITVKITSSPAWLTGVEEIDGFTLAAPRYADAPARVTRSLAAMSPESWTFDTTEDTIYATNHFAIRRIPDASMKAEFGQGEKEHADAVAITLPVEPGDRPLATRYAQLKLREPVRIPGKATALGLWIKGNSSWGRVIYQCRDARGEIWTSIGTRDDWNCDDTHAWSYVSFEGWRYVRFPLPGNRPWDSARELESTWWGSRDGDGIVDLPLKLEKIIVEARNEVPYLGVMKQVADRSYKLSGLVAEYTSESDATDVAVTAGEVRKPVPDWTGPVDNPIARLTAEGAGHAPAIAEFVEPSHFNDGRQMIIRFIGVEGTAYNLYLSRYEDGRGADLLRKSVKNNDLVTGLRPGIPLYFFLTGTGPDGRESQPSAAFRLITRDNFKEK